MVDEFCDWVQLLEGFFHVTNCYMICIPDMEHEVVHFKNRTYKHNGVHSRTI